MNTRTIDDVIASAKERERKTIFFAIVWLIVVLGFGIGLSLIIRRFGESQKQVSELQQKLNDLSINLGESLKSANRQIASAQGELQTLEIASQDTKAALATSSAQLKFVQEDLKVQVADATAKADAAQNILASIGPNIQALTQDLLKMDQRATDLDTRTRQLDQNVSATSRLASHISKLLEQYKQADELRSKGIEDRVKQLAAYSTIGLQGKSDKELIQNGKLRLFANDFEGAVSDFTSALYINPKSAVALRMRGVAEGALREYQDAISDFTKAIENDDKDADSFNDRGFVQTKLKLYSEAIGDFTKASELAPHAGLPLANRASSELELGKFDSAIADYNRAIELTPHFSPFYNGRGFVFLKRGDDAAAINDFKRASDLARTKAEKAGCLENIGLVYIRAAKWQDALRNAQMVDAISDSAWNKVLLGISATQLGKKDQATKAFGDWARLKTPANAEDLKEFLPEIYFPYVDGGLPGP